MSSRRKIVIKYRDTADDEKSDEIVGKDDSTVGKLIKQWEKLEFLAWWNMGQFWELMGRLMRDWMSTQWTGVGKFPTN